MSATTTRRRRLTLFIKTEFDASDGTLRVPAHHRGPVAAGAWWWAAIRCAPPVRTQGLEAAQPRRKGPTPPSPGRRARGSRPDPVRRDSHRQPAGSEVGGRHHLYQNLGGACVPGDGPRLLHQESSRVRDWGDSTRHRSRRARLSTWRPAGARRGERRRSSTPGRGSQCISAQLADHLEDYGTPPPSGKDRGVLGGCLGGSRRMRP